MLPDSGESSVADIAKRMKATVSLASHYKRRLVDQGVLCEAGRGYVEFSMPMLKPLLAEKKKKT
jgi:hypothetical protein